MAIDLEPEISISATGATATWRTWSSARIGAADRILFTERLTLFLETGVTLHSALQSLQQQSTDPRVARVIGAMIDDIIAGDRFSEALSRHPDLFPATYCNLVAASEAGGFLPQVLEQLVEMDEKQEKLRSTLIAALSYPIFLVVFSIGVMVFILMFVFPKFAVLFNSIYNELPLTTKLLLALSDLLTQHTLTIGTGLVVLIVGGYAVLKQPAMQYVVDRYKLRLPWVRDVYAKIYLTRLMRVMGLSLDRGVTILATLAACREIVANRQVQEFLQGLENQVTEGKGIAAGFEESIFIPVSVQQMIRTGEETGTLGRVMGRIADFYDRDLTKQLQQMARLAEPVMLLVMGVMVGTIVSSLILPIFKLSRAVH